jgi:DNA-binding XRE family transcriptional regulator
MNAIGTSRDDPSLPLAIQIARLFHKRVEAIFLAED